MAGDLQSTLALYKSNPEYFSDEASSSLETAANAYGINFSSYKNTSIGDDLAEVAKQAFGGFVSGVVVWDPFDAPTTLSGQMAYGIGHLFGFVGSLFATGGVGAFAGKAVGLTAKGMLGVSRIATEAKIARGALKGAEVTRAIEGWAETANTARKLQDAVSGFRSVPMWAADKIMEKTVFSTAGKSALSFLKNSPKIEHAIESGFHLGIASAVSDSKNGPVEAIKSGMFGFAFGGAFAKIGQLRFLAHNTWANKVIKAAAGAAVQGGISTYDYLKDPNSIHPAQLAEQYLMGAFFGWKSTNALRHRTARFMKGIPENLVRQSPMLLAKDPEFKLMSPEQQEDVIKFSSEFHDKARAGSILSKLASHLPFGKRLSDDFKLNSFTPGMYVQDPEMHAEGPVLRVDQATKTVVIKDEVTGAEHTIPIRRALHYDPPAETLDDGTIVEGRRSAASLRQEDYEAYRHQASKRRAVELIMGNPNMSPRELAANMAAFDQQVLEAIALSHTNKGETTATFQKFIRDVYEASHNVGDTDIGLVAKKIHAGKELTEKERDIKQQNEAMVKTYVRRLEQGPKLSAQDEGAIITVFDKELFGQVHNAAFIDGNSRVVKYKISWTDNKRKGRYRDADNNAHDSRSPYKLIQIYMSEVDPSHAEDAYLILKGFVDTTGSAMKKLRPIRELLDTAAENPDDKRPRINWKKIVGSLEKEGFYPFSGIGDHSEFAFVRTVLGKSRRGAKPLSVKGEMKRIATALNEFDPRFKEVFDELQKINMKRLGITAEQFNTMFFNNIRHHELLEGKDVGQWLKVLADKAGQKSAAGRSSAWLRTALDFNKRMQIMFSDFLPINGQRFVDAKGKKIDKIRYLMADDFATKGLIDQFGELLGIETTDGAIITSDRMMDAQLLHAGYTKEGGFFKAFIAERSAMGTLLGKFAQHRAGPELSAAMEELGVDYIIFDSAAKQRGHREITDLSYSRDDATGKGTFAVKGKTSVYHLKPSSVRFSTGIHDDPHHQANEMMRLAKQIMTTGLGPQATEAEQKAASDYQREQYIGQDYANQMIESYLLNPTREGLNKLFTEVDGIAPIEQAGLQDILTLMMKPGAEAFRKNMRMFMLKDNMNGNAEDLTEWDLGDSERGESPEPIEKTTAVLDFLRIATGSDAASLVKFTAKTLESNMINWFVKRVTNPKVPQAGKAYMRSFDWGFLTNKKYKLIAGDKNQRGNFYLDLGMKSQRIFGYDKLGERRWMTLGEQVDILNPINKGLGREQLQKDAGRYGLLDSPIGKEIVADLAKKFPMVDARAIEHVFAVNGDEVAGKALGLAVEWSTTHGGLDTPPHEYAHVYVDMFQSHPLIAAAIKDFGSKELLVQKMGEYYADRIQDKTLRSKVGNFLQQFWRNIKAYFGTLGADERWKAVGEEFFKGRSFGAEEGPVVPIPRYEQAWHGSPHKFSQFLLEKIGSGEGFQAYGWGLYFTGSRNIALKHYAERMAKRMSIDKGHHQFQGPKKLVDEKNNRLDVNDRLLQLDEDLSGEPFDTDAVQRYGAPDMLARVDAVMTDEWFKTQLRKDEHVITPTEIVQGFPLTKGWNFAFDHGVRGVLEFAMASQGTGRGELGDWITLETKAIGAMQGQLVKWLEGEVSKLLDSTEHYEPYEMREAIKEVHKRFFEKADRLVTAAVDRRFDDYRKEQGKSKDEYYAQLAQQRDEAARAGASRESNERSHAEFEDYEEMGVESPFYLFNEYKVRSVFRDNMLPIQDMFALTYLAKEKAIRWHNKGEMFRPNLYRVDLSENTKWLDWDKPLTTEEFNDVTSGLGASKEVEMLISHFSGERQEKYEAYIEQYRNKSFREVYKMLASILVHGAPRTKAMDGEVAASNHLQKKGYAGHSYQGESSGVRNHVVYDEQAIKLLQHEQYQRIKRGKYDKDIEPILAEMNKSKSKIQPGWHISKFTGKVEMNEEYSVFAGEHLNRKRPTKKSLELKGGRTEGDVDVWAANMGFEDSEQFRVAYDNELTSRSRLAMAMAQEEAKASQEPSIWERTDNSQPSDQDMPPDEAPPLRAKEVYTPKPRSEEQPPVDEAPARRKLPSVTDITDEKISDLIRRTLRAVVLRVPMDEVSGAQSLDFAGFTDRKGGGILLHHKNMARLGGADLDIDSAFFYFGMPDATHTMLERNRDNQAVLARTAEFAPRLFAQQDSDIAPYLDKNDGLKTAMGMFSPYHRLKIGYEVSKGRGKMLGVAVSNRFLIGSLMQRISGVVGNRPSVTFDLNDGEDKIRLTNRSDGGLLFRAYAKAAINMAADVGKEGGMVDAATMRAVLLQGAFSKIERISVNKKTGEIITTDLLKGSRINAKLSGMTDGERRKIGKGLRDFASKGLYSIKEVELFKDANDKLYSKDRASGRNWSFTEVVESAKRFPTEWRGPFKDMVQEVAKLSYHDSLLERFAQSTNFGRDVLREITQILGAHKESYDFIPGAVGDKGVKLPYSQLIRRVALFSRHYRPFDTTSTDNFTTKAGAYAFAADHARFWSFVQEYAVDVRGFKSTRAFHNQMVEDLMDQWDVRQGRDKYFMAKPQLERDAIRKAEFTKKDQLFLGKYAPHERGEWLLRETEATDQYLSHRLMDLTSYKMLRDYYEISGLAPTKDLPPEVEKVLKLEHDRIWQKVVAIKREYSKYWLQRRDQGEFNESPGSMDKIVDEWNAFKDELRGWVKTMEQDGAIMSVDDVLNYADAVLLSSMRGTENDKPGAEMEHTAFGRLGPEMVDPQVIRKFTTILDETLSLLQAPYVKGQGADWVNQAEREMNTNQAPKAYVYHRDSYLSKDYDPEAEWNPRMEAIYAQLHGLLSERGVRGDDMMKLLRSKYGVAQISDLTMFEVKGLLHWLKSMKRGPGVMNRVLYTYKKWANREEQFSPFSWRHTMQFVQTTADEMKKDYLIFKNSNLIQSDGTMRFDLPLKHVNEELGKIENVFADTQFATNEFETLINVANNIESHQSQFIAHFTRLAQERVGWMGRGIKRPGSDEDESHKLVTSQIFLMEKNGAQQELKEFLELESKRAAAWRTSVEDATAKKTIEDLNAKVKAATARADKATAYFNEISREIFDIGGPGKGERLEGRQIIGKMKRDTADLMEQLNRELIEMRPDWFKSAVVTKEVAPGVFIVDLHKSYLDNESQSFFNKTFIDASKEKMTYDEVMFRLWADEVHRKAKTEARVHGVGHVGNEAQVERLKSPRIEQDADHFEGLRDLTYKGRRMFLYGYSAFMHNADNNAKLEHVYKVRLAKSDAGKAGYAQAKGDYLMGDNFTDSAIRVQSYLRKRVRSVSERGAKVDVRAREMGMRTFSQFELDKIFSGGKMDPVDYWTATLMDDPKNRFHYTGKLQGYWPHMNYDPVEAKKFLQSQTEELMKMFKPGSPEFIEAHDALKGRYFRVMSQDNSEDGHLSMSILNGMLGLDEYGERIDGKKKHTPSFALLENLGGGKAVANMLRREVNMSGYSTSMDVIPQYISKLSSGIMRNFGAFHSRRIIDSFEANNREGKFTRTWANWMRMYVRDTLGGASLFSPEILEDKMMNIKRTPYYWLSDHMMFKLGTKFEFVARKLLGFDKFSKAQFAAFRKHNGKDADESEMKKRMDSLWTQFKGSEEGMEFLSRRLRNLSTLEGRYEMATLLFHSKTAITNMLGGSINNTVWVGARHMRYSLDPKTWEGINPEWTSLKKVYEWVQSVGAIEDFILNEGAILTRSGDAKWNAFFTAAVGKMKKDPTMEDSSLFRLAKEHGITDKILRTNAIFMLKSERLLRAHSFMASYLQAREAFEPLNRLPYDTPFLIDQAKKGIAATQFLYSNANRPAFARTNMGKVYTRFKLWSWSSVRFQREIIQNAADHGYRPGTKEFERYQRLQTANLFAIALATLLPYSIFDYSLPAPLSYFQSTADWLYGNTKQRERAFFAKNVGIPQFLAPLNELMPPIARLPKGLLDLDESFKLLLDGEVSRLAEYTTYSLFPYGRMGKDLAKAYQNPMQTPSFLLGVPLDALSRLKKKSDQNPGQSWHELYSRLFKKGLLKN